MVSGVKLKMSQPILFFQSAQNNMNVVEDIEILLPVKFR